MSKKYFESNADNFESLFPELLPEWDYVKNADLLPSQFSPYSSKFVWWKCAVGHEWQASPAMRAYGDSCPICKLGHRISSFSEFTEFHKSLAAEWNHERNADIEDDPDAYRYSSLVWWKCRRCGCEWQMTIKRRRKGGGCPNCSGNRTPISQYDTAGNLIDTFPSISEAARSIGGRPTNISACLNGRTQAAYGYIWKYSNISAPAGVMSPNPPELTRVITGFNDIETLYPDIVKEWDYEKNTDLSPSDVAASARNIKIWWICSNGHKYRATPCSRTSNGSGCPYCSGRKLLSGVNDLSTMFPDLADEWNYDKNGDLLPSDVYYRSTKSVWWKCRKCGKEWRNNIRSRKEGQGCPSCNGTMPPVSFEQFSERYPDIAFEWNHEKNKDIENNANVYGADSKVWWKCKKCGNEWQAKIVNRNYGNKCPRCAKKEASEKIGRAVNQYNLSGELIQTYGSITLAAKITRLPISTISSCLHGLMKSAGGYIWRYVENCSDVTII